MSTGTKSKPDLPDASGSEPADLVDRIKSRAIALGFALCGITSADAPPHHALYRQWLADGNAGEMQYLHRQEPKRADLSSVLPGAKSVICVALNYSPEDGTYPGLAPLGHPSLKGRVDETTASDSLPFKEAAGVGVQDSLPFREGVGVGALTGVVARYAQFDDYHETMWARLEELLEFLKSECPGADGKVYCDTGPITERDLAMRAGIGWIGKHTNLISRRLGNFFFLGEIVVDVALPADVPETPHCGTCTRCIPACPTGAITAPYVLDSRRCISYLTIELKGSIPEDLRPLIGTRIYGCDDCLAVCPWNKFAKAASDAAVEPRADLSAPDLIELLSLDEDGFRERFRNSPIRRTKRRGLLRNVCVALGNLGDPRAIPALTTAAESDPEPLVREHARWALEKIAALRPGAMPTALGGHADVAYAPD